MVTDHTKNCSSDLCLFGAKNSDEIVWPTSCWENTIIIHLSGEIDMHNAMSLRQDLSIHERKKVDIIVDFSRLEFIDSAGLAVLVSALNAQEKQNRRLCISGAQGSPRQVLRLTRLDQIFPLFDSPFKAGLKTSAKPD